MIQALGTVGQKIYFTSWHDDSVGGDTNGNGGNSAPSPGNWKYIRFDDASDDASLIDYAVIRYGGGWSAAGGVEIHDASPTIRNCQISQHYTDGIYLDTTVSSLPSRPQIFTNTLSSNSSYAVSSNVDSRPQLRGNSLTGNGGNGLEIRGGSIQNDLTWDQTQVVYILSGDVSIASSAQLTMAPGLILKFRDNCGLLVGGNLHAVGTVGQKIYFTSWRDDSAGGDTNGDGGNSTPSPGNWKSIRFDDASDDASLIEYAVIRYGGGWYAPGGIEIHDASPTIRNSQISQHNTTGIYLDTTVSSLPAQPRILTNTLSSNNSYVVSSNVDSKPRLRGNSLTGNGGNGLEIRGGAIQSDLTWDQTQIVYILSGDVSIASSAQLTMAPGLILKFRDNCGLLVGGNLHAVGTVGQKIYFTSWRDDSAGGDTNGDGGNSTPSPGNWKSIRFDDASDDASLIEYAIIRYGGGWYAPGGIEIHDASPTIRNSQISQHNTTGIYLDTTVSSLPAQPRILTNTLSSNNSYVVSSNVDSKPHCAATV